jgi:hypothetical protein
LINFNSQQRLFFMNIYKLFPATNIRSVDQQYTAGMFPRTVEQWKPVSNATREVSTCIWVTVITAVLLPSTCCSPACHPNYRD